MNTPPLIFCPGLLCTEDLYADQVARLSKTRPVVVADFRGDDHDSIDAMADAVLGLVEGPFDLAGLSMGGYVALATAREADGRMRKLALMDTSAKADSPERKQDRARLIDQVKVGKFAGVTSAILPLFIHHDRLNDGPLVDRIKSMTQSIGAETYCRQQTAIINRVDSRPYLSDIDAKTLVVCGREDVITPVAESEEIAHAIPGARLEIIEQCGHLSTMERPTIVTELLEQHFN